MASSSEVKADLDDVSVAIRNQRAVVAECVAKLTSAVSALNSITTNKADLVSTINAYTPTGAFETLAKDEFSKLQAELATLRSAMNTAISQLGNA